MGYEGGEAERALLAENDNVDRASVRLSQKYSGFHGLHCLSKGNCFGDPHKIVFRLPQSLSIPVNPPALQLPPPPTNAAEATLTAKNKANEKRLVKEGEAQPQGVDLSEQVLPKLDPFKEFDPLPSYEERKREEAETRRTMGPSKGQDAFTDLMKNWLTTLSSPFHTRKPHSNHPSDPESPPMPSLVHQRIVPTIMRNEAPTATHPYKHVVAEFYQPSHGQGLQTVPTHLNFQELKKKLEREEREEEERQNKAIVDKAHFDRAYKRLTPEEKMKRQMKAVLDAVHKERENHSKKESIKQKKLTGRLNRRKQHHARKRRRRRQARRLIHHSRRSRLQRERNGQAIEATRMFAQSVEPEIAMVEQEF